MTMVNSQAWDSLQPLWVMGSGQTDENQYIYNYGTKLMASYGNNGNSMNAYVKGVARGGFKIPRILDTTGVNDTMISLWRDSSNVVKYKVGSSSTTTVGTFTDTFVFGGQLQSPASVELIMAMNLAVTAS